MLYSHTDDFGERFNMFGWRRKPGAAPRIKNHGLWPRAVLEVQWEHQDGSVEWRKSHGEFTLAIAPNEKGEAS